MEFAESPASPTNMREASVASSTSPSSTSNQGVLVAPFAQSPSASTPDSSYATSTTSDESSDDSISQGRAQRRAADELIDLESSESDGTEMAYEISSSIDESDHGEDYTAPAVEPSPGPDASSDEHPVAVDQEQQEVAEMIKARFFGLPICSHTAHRRQRLEHDNHLRCRRPQEINDRLHHRECCAGRSTDPTALSNPGVSRVRLLRPGLRSRA